MASGKAADRKAKLASALKQNLKRRKTGTAAAGKDDAASSQDLGLGAGIAPQKGLKTAPAGLKTASKRT